MTTKNSTLVANRAASPPVLSDVSLEGGRERVAQGTIALATTDIDNADVIKLVTLPTGVRITEIWIANDDLDSNGTPTLTAEVGVYDGDTAKDSDRYANASTELQSANTKWVQMDERTADLKGQTLWEDAGDSEDPGGVYTIAITIDGAPATAAAGDLAFKVCYTLD